MDNSSGTPMTEQVDQKFILASKILLAAFAVRAVSALAQGILFVLTSGLTFTLREFLNIIFSSIGLAVAMLLVVYLTNRAYEWIKWLLLFIIITEIYWRFYSHAIFEYDLFSWWAYLLSSALIFIAAVILFVPTFRKK